MATATATFPASSWTEECRRLKEMWDSLPLAAEMEEMEKGTLLWGDLVPLHITISITPPPEEKTSPLPSPKISPVPARNTNPSLRIGNLSTASDARTLRSTLERTFGTYGPIRDINIPLDRTTRNPRGFAFIEFRSPDDAEAAYDGLLGRLNIGGRDIRVEYAISNRKSSEEMAARK